MARIADYMVVWKVEYEAAEYGPETLVTEVKRMIDDGWEPIGGLAIYSEPRSDGEPRVVLAQAMVRGYA